MRNKSLALLLVMLIQPPFDFAHTQNPAQNGSQTGGQTPDSGQTTQSPQQVAADGSAQPLSLAEMARLARAKRQGDGSAKPAARVVLDDDNMPRGVYADAPAGAGSGPAVSSSAARGSGPFAEFRGKVILLDFWASWCGPCRSALPNLKRLQSAYSGDDFVVVSISEDDDEATWHEFTASRQMTWPQRFDPDGALEHQFGVNALPTYVLIGRDGNVIQKIVGEDPAQSLMERIGPELKKSLSAKS